MEKSSQRCCCSYVIQAFFFPGLILCQSEIENSEMDCQPKAYHSAHDRVGNQVFSLEQAVLDEYLLQCFKWHRGGVFPLGIYDPWYCILCLFAWNWIYCFYHCKTGICLQIQSHFCQLNLTSYLRRFLNYENSTLW